MVLQYPLPVRTLTVEEMSFIHTETIVVTKYSDTDIETLRNGNPTLATTRVSAISMLIVLLPHNALWRR